MTDPVHWPSLSEEEAAREWAELRRWVTSYQQRYAHGVRLPECWWQHPEIVETLSALRDCERGCFDHRASACSAMQWQRARRDADAVLRNWIKRLTCLIPGRGHPEA